MKICPKIEKKSSGQIFGFLPPSRGGEARNAASKRFPKPAAACRRFRPGKSCGARHGLSQVEIWRQSARGRPRQGRKTKMGSLPSPVQKYYRERWCAENGLRAKVRVPGWPCGSWFSVDGRWKKFRSEAPTAPGGAQRRLGKLRDF